MPVLHFKRGTAGQPEHHLPRVSLGQVFWFVVQEHLFVSRRGWEKSQHRLCVLIWNGRGSGTGGQWGESRGGTHPALAPCDRVCEYPCALRTFALWKSKLMSHMNSGQWLPSWKGASCPCRNPLVYLTCSSEGAQVAQVVRNLPANAGDTRNVGSIQKIPWRREWQVFLSFQCSFHSSVLSWKIPWTEEPGGL